MDDLQAVFRTFDFYLREGFGDFLNSSGKLAGILLHFLQALFFLSQRLFFLNGCFGQLIFFSDKFEYGVFQGRNFIPNYRNFALVGNEIYLASLNALFQVLLLKLQPLDFYECVFPPTNQRRDQDFQAADLG